MAQTTGLHLRRTRTGSEIGTRGTFSPAQPSKARRAVRPHASDGNTQTLRSPCGAADFRSFAQVLSLSLSLLFGVRVELSQLDTAHAVLSRSELLEQLGPSDAAIVAALEPVLALECADA
jgi:hypothetical protein